MIRLLKESARSIREAIQLKSPREIEAMRESGRLVAEAFAMLKEAVQPGVTLRELDKMVAEFLRRRGAQPLYKGYRGNPPAHPPFPGVICASVNEQVCHGVPDKRILRQGDVVGIDIGLKYNGFCGDACETYAVGKISPEAQRLLKVAQECREVGIAAAQVGRHLSDIGAAIEAHAKAHGYSIVSDWGGHGIGRHLHEPPSVPHSGPGGRGPRLRPGIVFTIEPMVNGGVSEWKLLKDGWTVVTADGALSAQFEHTIVITPDGPEILSKL